MSEIWKDIIGYEGLYQVSNLGRVKSCERYVNHFPDGKRVVKERILKHGLVKGYHNVQLSNNNIKITKLVAGLIATAFIYNNDKTLEINHKNGNRLDNRVDNLEWISHKENQEHAIKNKLYRMFAVVEIENNQIIKRFNSLNEAAREYNLKSGNVWNVCEKKRKHSKGHYFEYSFI